MKSKGTKLIGFRNLEHQGSGKVKKTLLAQANSAFHSGDYEKALKLYKQLKKDGFLTQTIDLNIAIIENNRNRSRKYNAISIHVFYIDVWYSIKDKLKSITDFDYKIFVTCTKELFPLLNKELADSFSSFEILEVSNDGMDVLPFLKANRKFEFYKYDAVLKLHTKNTKDKDRSVQGELIYTSLLNKNVLELVNERKDIKFAIFPGYFIRKIDEMMYGNRWMFNELINTFSKNKVRGSFFSAGTMFWVSGNYLKGIYDHYYQLEAFFQKYNINAVTGIDGSAAHAFERILGALVDDSTIELSFRVDSTDKSYAIAKVNEVQQLVSEIQYADSLAHLNNYSSINKWASRLSKDNVLSDEYYRNEIKKIGSSDLSVDTSPAAHCISVGDIAGIDPSPNFSVNFYKLYHADVFKAKIPAVVHYLSAGRKENRACFPTYLTAKYLLEKFDVFKNDCLKQKLYNAVGSSPLLSMFRKLRDVKLKNSFLDQQDYFVFKEVMKHLVVAQRTYDSFRRAYHSNDFQACSQISIDFLDIWGETLESQELLGLSALMSLRFDKAKSYYEKLWDNYLIQNIGHNKLFSQIQYDEKNKTPNNGLFNEALPVKKKLDNKKICVYTTLYGNRDELPPILTKCEGVDFICFSDKEHPYSDWKVIVVPPEFNDNNLDAKRFKILPHKFLKEYDASIFVDANTYCVGNFLEFISTYLINNSFVMFKHPGRQDLYKEVSTIVAHKRHRPKEILDQLESYCADGLPHDTGLVEGSFIWRVHNDKVINAFMDDWWSHIIKYSKRDQISLGYLMWRNNLRPRVLPDYLGDSRDNIYFRKFPHKKSSASIKEQKTRNLYFVYSEKYKKSGSTIMRGFQLFDMIKNDDQKNKKQHIKSINLTKDVSEVFDSYLFLTKGFLTTTNQHELQLLKQRNNVIICDYVDGKLNKDYIEYFDILAAASISAFIYYKLKFPKKNVFLLTHHADPRIENKCPELGLKNGRAAYFGEMANTIYSEEIKELVDFYLVDTSGKNQSLSWLDHIDEYEYHYLVRKKRNIDGFKPFTKGFISACVNAKPLLEYDITDAKYYLGYHYPYYIEGGATNIYYELSKVVLKSSAESKDLAGCYVRQLRGRSTPEFICAEFWRMMDSASYL